MKRMSAIGMLMFTVLVCSCGPSQEEFDELKQQKERLSEEVQELNEIVRFVDGDVTRITRDDMKSQYSKIYYLKGDNERFHSSHPDRSQCYKDAEISFPLPKSCKCGFQSHPTVEQLFTNDYGQSCVKK